MIEMRQSENKRSEINKIPFMIIVGDQEVENFSYPVRGHGGVNFGKIEDEPKLVFSMIK